MIDTLMIFAAGRGTRMEHLTDKRPKSLIPILKKPILHYSLELALTYNFKRIIINSHYLHNQISDSISEFKANYQSQNLPEIIEVFESKPLETGGAIKNAKKYLGDKPIFTLNSDVIIKADVNIFNHMQENWNTEIMNFLLLLQPFNEAHGYRGVGDFELQTNGQLSRPKNLKYYSFMYAGLSIIKPVLISNNVAETFSLKDYYLNLKNVYGTSLQGCKWYHATTPQDIEAIENAMQHSS